MYGVYLCIYKQVHISDCNGRKRVLFTSQGDSNGALCIYRIVVISVGYGERGAHSAVADAAAAGPPGPLLDVNEPLTNTNMLESRERFSRMLVTFKLRLSDSDLLYSLSLSLRRARLWRFSARNNTNFTRWLSDDGTAIKTLLII